MILQLALGAVFSLINMTIMVLFVGGFFKLLHLLERNRETRHLKPRSLYALLGFAMAMVLFANSACVWMWAGLFHSLEIFVDLEEALYFSLVSFTTAGYGEVVAGKDWRLLTGFVGVNGLLAFGIFTAFLIEIMRDVDRAQGGE